MATIFTRIIDGEIPGTFIWRDPECVAFMSINPIRSGHVLVVPRDEVDHWLDCPPHLLAHLFEVARQIGEGIEQVFRPERIGLIVAGLEVPHLHIHVIPIDSEGDLSFANAATGVEREELEEAAGSIRYVLTAAGADGVSD
jgi:histidine triad (HIT) family protein